VDARGIVRKLPLQVGQAESLLAMTAEYTFFTPAVLYLYGCFADAILIDLMRELGREVPLYHRRFAHPIFRGLELPDGDADWNHVLWACRPADYEPLSTFLISLTLALSRNRVILCYGEQKLSVVDPLALERKGVYHDGLPWLDIYAFGINGSAGRVAFRQTGRSPAELPRLVRLEADGEIRASARALFAGDNPCIARRDYRLARQKEDGREAPARDQSDGGVPPGNGQ
jgi:hypothetical protein